MDLNFSWFRNLQGKIDDAGSLFTSLPSKNDVIQGFSFFCRQEFSALVYYFLFEALDHQCLIFMESR